MSERTEREAIARIIQEARDRPDIMAIHIADIVLREHIEPLRAALRLDQQVEDINVAIQRTRAENAEAALGRMEFERDQAKVARDELSARYGDVSEKLAEAHYRASALEAELHDGRQAADIIKRAAKLLQSDHDRASALEALLAEAQEPLDEAEQAVDRCLAMIEKGSGPPDWDWLRNVRKDARALVAKLKARTEPRP